MTPLERALRERIHGAREIGQSDASVSCFTVPWLIEPDDPKTCRAQRRHETVELHSAPTPAVHEQGGGPIGGTRLPYRQPVITAVDRGAPGVRHFAGAPGVAGRCREEPLSLASRNGGREPGSHPKPRAGRRQV